MREVETVQTRVVMNWRKGEAETTERLVKGERERERERGGEGGRGHWSFKSKTKEP